MDVFFLLIGLALALFAAAAGLLVWLIRAGQLDDLDTPPLRMLADDAAARPEAQPGRKP